MVIVGRSDLHVAKNTATARQLAVVKMVSRPAEGRDILLPLAPPVGVGGDVVCENEWVDVPVEESVFGGDVLVPVSAVEVVVGVVVVGEGAGAMEKVPDVARMLLMSEIPTASSV